MRKKQTTCNGERYETIPGEKAFTKIYDSLILSPAFTDLSPKQRILYIICKLQTWGHSKPMTAYKGMQIFQGQEYFFLSTEDIKPYKLYGETNKRDFFKDMKALISHGFVEMVSSGKRLHHKNVYKLSDKWQQWERPPDN